MLSALRKLFAPKQNPALRELADRLTALERSEAERERVLAEQLTRLASFWKRIRQREAYDDREEERGGHGKLDPTATRAVLALKLGKGL
jgi:hypothetical protein